MVVVLLMKNSLYFFPILCHLTKFSLRRAFNDLDEEELQDLGVEMGGRKGNLPTQSSENQFPIYPGITNQLYV